MQDVVLQKDLIYGIIWTICLRIFIFFGWGKGNFNIILDDLEKLGGLPVTLLEMLFFSRCITSCDLNELKFTRSRYTWWNGRIEDDYIFKIFDSVFRNNEFMQLLPNSEVHHLIRQGSNHDLQM